MKNAPYFKETWKKTMEEIDEYKNNKLGRKKIEILSEEKLKEMKQGFITPRFGIPQPYPKVRPIDDYRELNQCTHVQE